MKKSFYTYALVAVILLIAIIVYTPTNRIVGSIQRDRLFREDPVPPTWVYIMPCLAPRFCPEEITIIRYATAQAEYDIQIIQIENRKRKTVDYEIITKRDSLRAEFLKIVSEHKNDKSVIKILVNENETFSISKPIGRYVVYAFYDSTVVGNNDFWLTFFDSGFFNVDVKY